MDVHCKEGGAHLLVKQLVLCCVHMGGAFACLHAPDIHSQGRLQQ